MLYLHKILAVSAAARSGRPGWEARWGPEEVHRASALASSTEATNVPFPGIASADPVAHPSYSGKRRRPAGCTHRKLSIVNGLVAGRHVSNPLFELPVRALSPSYAERSRVFRWELHGLIRMNNVVGDSKYGSGCAQQEFVDLI